MNKTFIEILSEKDQEHVYHVLSTADIHDPDRAERVRLEFMPFDIKSFECEAYKPLSKVNTVFPEEPNSPIFTIKVVTRYPLTTGFIKTLAWAVRVNAAHLKIDPDPDYDPVNKPEEVSSSDSQKLVGSKRIGDFIRDLQQDRKDRKEMEWTREVYESFFTTHRGLQGVIKRPIRNGYYLVETYKEDGKKYLRAEGPFESRPEGNPYHDHIRASNPQMISETNNGGLYGVQVLVENFDID
jgi:hypothetical protein